MPTEFDDVVRIEYWEFRCKVRDVLFVRVAKRSIDELSHNWHGDFPNCLVDRDTHPDCGWEQVS